MKRGLAIFVGGVLLCAVPYLAWLNPTSVDVHLAPNYVLPSIQLGVVLVLAFLSGAAAILFSMLIQSTGRWVRGQWTGRRTRRDARGDALEHQGRALLWQGESERGRALLLRAWRRDATRRRAVLTAAASYNDDGDAENAERVLLDAIDQHGTDGELLLALSDACARQGDHTGAIHALEQLRAQHPHAARVLIALRDRYAAAQRWADAAAVQSVYLRTLHKSARLTRERQRLLGLEYESARTHSEPAERITALEPLIEANPSFVPALVSLGDALIAAGRTNEAIALWERSLRNAPRSIFLERLVPQAAEPRQRQQWLQLLRKLRSASVQSDSVQLWQARLQLLDGHADDVVKQIDALPSSARTTAFAHRLRAEALRQLGQVDQALNEYAQPSNGAAPGYRCRDCGQQTSTWIARCPQCAAWDSYRAGVELATD